MDKRIHFNTIQRYLKTKYNADIEQREFVNNKTGEIYNVILPKGTDIAVFSVKNDKSYICIDSSGEEVDKKNIIGYVNNADTSKDEFGILFSEKDLVLHFRNETIDVAQLIEREKAIYPERTSIVLNATLRALRKPENIKPFYVDEVHYVSNEEFEKIFNLENHPIIEEYNNKRYKLPECASNGLVFINDDGDGLIVAPQGYDYARFMTFAPQIEASIDNQLDGELERKAVYEMKMYVPLRVVEREIEFDKHYDIDGGIYFNKIRDTVRKDEIQNEKRGFAAYFRDGSRIKQNKVYSMKPDVERVNDIMMGVVAIKMTVPLTELEINELKDYMTGQFANAWGESFAQQAIQVDGNEIYVHFWNNEEYFIKTEDEMAAEQEIEMQGIQGMQGMSGMSGM